MTQVIGKVGPRAFVFENVARLTTAKWTADGRPGELWDEIYEAFVKVETSTGGRPLGYRVAFAKVHAKEYGVPQNRPRLLMVGIRSDITPSIDARQGGDLAEGFLPVGGASAPDPQELWGDLVDDAWVPGGRTESYPSPASTAIQRELRSRRDGRIARKGDPVTDQSYSNHSSRVMTKFLHMILTGGDIPADMQTKKFGQRVSSRNRGDQPARGSLRRACRTTSCTSSIPVPLPCASGQGCRPSPTGTSSRVRERRGAPPRWRSLHGPLGQASASLPPRLGTRCR